MRNRVRAITRPTPRIERAGKVTEAYKAETFLRVECYAGHRGDQRPLRFVLGGRTFVISEVEDKWYSPGATFFRVVTADEDRYLLRHDDAQDVWSLDGYTAKHRPAVPVTPLLESDDSGLVH